MSSCTLLVTADPYAPHLMYFDRASIKASVRRWMTIRGTSKLEGFHRWLNALLASGNCSPELAGVLIILFVCSWNINAGIRNKGKPDYGTHEHR